MLSKLKRIFDSLRSGEPGHRFVDHHERKKTEEGRSGTWKSAGHVILGLVLLAVRFRILAMYLDKLELLGRGLWRQVQRLIRAVAGALHPARRSPCRIRSSSPPVVR